MILFWRKIDSNYQFLYCKYNWLPIIVFPLYLNTPLRPVGAAYGTDAEAAPKVVGTVPS